MNTKSSNIAVVLAWGSILFAGPAAHALAPMPTGQIVESQKVKFADLDLATDRGALALLQRLQVASFAVCGGVSNEAWDAYGACRANAVRDAVAQINSARLTALYNGRHPHAQIIVD